MLTSSFRANGIFLCLIICTSLICCSATGSEYGCTSSASAAASSFLSFSNTTAIVTSLSAQCVPVSATNVPYTGSLTSVAIDWQASPSATGNYEVQVFNHNVQTNQFSKDSAAGLTVSAADIGVVSYALPSSLAVNSNQYVGVWLSDGSVYEDCATGASMNVYQGSFYGNQYTGPTTVQCALGINVRIVVPTTATTSTPTTTTAATTNTQTSTSFAMKTDGTSSTSTANPSGASSTTTAVSTRQDGTSSTTAAPAGSTSTTIHHTDSTSTTNPSAGSSSSSTTSSTTQAHLVSSTPSTANSTYTCKDCNRNSTSTSTTLTPTSSGSSTTASSTTSTSTTARRTGTGDSTRVMTTTTPTTATTTTPSPVQQATVKISIRFPLNCTQYAALAEYFNALFINTTAATLGIDPSRLIIVDFACGSTILHVIISTPTVNGGADSTGSSSGTAGNGGSGGSDSANATVSTSNNQLSAIDVATQLQGVVNNGSLNVPGMGVSTGLSVLSVTCGDGSAAPNNDPSQCPQGSAGNGSSSSSTMLLVAVAVGVCGGVLILGVGIFAWHRRRTSEPKVFQSMSTDNWVAPRSSGSAFYQAEGSSAVPVSARRSAGQQYAQPETVQVTIEGQRN